MSTGAPKKLSKAKNITSKKRDLVSDVGALISLTEKLYNKYVKLHEKLEGAGSAPKWETSVALETKTETKSGRKITDREATVMDASDVPLFLEKFREHFESSIKGLIEAGKRSKTLDENGKVVPRAPGGLVLTGLYRKEFGTYAKALFDAKVVDISQAELDVIQKKNLCNLTVARRLLRLDWLAQPGRKSDDKIMSATPLMKKHLSAILAECTKDGMNVNSFKYAQLGKLSAKCAVDKKNMSDADKAKHSGDSASNELLVALYKKIKPADSTVGEENGEAEDNGVENGEENGHEEANGDVEHEESAAPAEEEAPVDEEEAPKITGPVAPVEPATGKRVRQRARPAAEATN